MSHIHIPDGVLPIWLVLSGWLIALGILYFCVRRVRNIKLEKKLSLVGIVSALMIVGMTLEIVPIVYHINMTVIAGILLGRALGFIAVFIVDLIVAMFGHGGITVVGLNTLIVGAEAVIGFHLFWLFSSFLRNGGLSVAIPSALATIISLALSTSLMIGVVYVSHIKPESILGVDKKYSQEIAPLPTDSGKEINDKRMNIGAFAKLVFFLGIFGWILEAVITAFVIGYIYKVRPDLISSKIA